MRAISVGITSDLMVVVVERIKGQREPVTPIGCDLLIADQIVHNVLSLHLK
jgi:hypothetical protein